MKRSEKSCSRCLKSVHCRYDCQICDFTLCDECHSAKTDSHEHRSFVSIDAPFRSLKITVASSGQHRCTNLTVSNCGRCQVPIDLKQQEFRCKTCLLHYDGSVNLCKTCYSESWACHDQSHEVLSIDFESVSHDSQSGLGCRQCNRQFPSINKITMTHHTHNNYVLRLDPRSRELAVNTAFRLCQLKPFRKDQPQVLGCARCKHEFPSLTMRICAGICEGVFCEHCFPLASVNHMHGPMNFRSLADQTLPEVGFLPAGWRAMQNKEGRVYYIQDHTGSFTFNKPEVPKTLPAGWVTVVDPNGKTMYHHPQLNISSYVSPVYGTAPPGWELKQTEKGRLFYVNRQTKATSWHKPHSESLPPGWEAGQHSDGRVYYINHVTKTNTWIKPTLPANAVLAQPAGQVTTAIHPVSVNLSTAQIHRPTTATFGSQQTSMRPTGLPSRPASVTASQQGFATVPATATVRPQYNMAISTTLPTRPLNSVSNQGNQPVRPAAMPTNTTVVRSRPVMERPPANVVINYQHSGVPLSMNDATAGSAVIHNYNPPPIHTETVNNGPPPYSTSSESYNYSIGVNQSVVPPATYDNVYVQNNIDIVGSSSQNPAIYQDANGGQAPLYANSDDYNIVSSSSTATTSIGDVNTYQVQVQETDTSLSVDSSSTSLGILSENDSSASFGFDSITTTSDVGFSMDSFSDY